MKQNNKIETGKTKGRKQW